jgi:hypothetical protein
MSLKESERINVKNAWEGKQKGKSIKREGKTNQ